MGHSTPIKKESVIENKYALLIGVESFKDESITNLNGVTRDIENFSNILNNRQISDFKVKTLLNSGLITSRKAISEISSTAQENDIVFFLLLRSCVSE